jgi:hypothetical protein
MTNVALFEVKGVHGAVPYYHVVIEAASPLTVGFIVNVAVAAPEIVPPSVKLVVPSIDTINLFLWQVH